MTVPPGPPNAENATQFTSSLDVARAVLGSGRGQPVRFIAVGGSEPKFLVPHPARVGAAVCRSYNGLRSARRRIERRAVATALNLGGANVVGRTMVIDDDPGFGIEAGAGLLDELARRLGTEVCAGVGLGRLDAYWKPVLQLFSPAGRPVGYAKVGWNPVTRALVEAEWAALEDVSGRIRGILVPKPLHRFDWGELTVVVTAPLPPRSRRLPDGPPPPPPDALESVDGPVRSAELAGLAWWQEVLDRIDAGAAVAGVPELMAATRSLADVHGPTEVRVGRQHGDWVPWNMGRDPATGSLVVWDWEYSRSLAPLGIDVVHGRYQDARLLRGLDDVSAFADAHADAPGVLAAAHAAMVASRRCWAASLGVDDSDGGVELRAAAGVLSRLVDRQGAT